MEWKLLFSDTPWSLASYALPDMMNNHRYNPLSALSAQRYPTRRSDTHLWHHSTNTRSFIIIKDEVRLYSMPSFPNYRLHIIERKREGLISLLAVHCTVLLYATDAYTTIQLGRVYDPPPTMQASTNVCVGQEFADICCWTAPDSRLFSNATTRRTTLLRSRAIVRLIVSIHHRPFLSS